MKFLKDFVITTSITISFFIGAVLLSIVVVVVFNRIAYDTSYTKTCIDDVTYLKFAFTRPIVQVDKDNKPVLCSK